MILSSVPRPDCSIVVPVFNSAVTLPKLVSRLESSLRAKRLDFELIFVEDGSKDASWEELVRLRKGREGRLKAIRLTRNFGQHNALLCGFNHCNGRAVVTLDDDLQHLPEDVPRLLRELARGFDLVYGVSKELRHGRLRHMASALSRWSFRLAIPGLHPRFSSFRALRLEAARRVVRLNTPFTFIDGSLAWIVGRVGTIEVKTAGRVHGKSGYDFARLLGYSMNILTTFSDLPLRLSLLAGLMVALSGVSLSLAIVTLQLMHGGIRPGWFATAAILLVGSMILVAQSINGEYIGRINHKTSGRPPYLEREALTDRRRGRR